MVVSGLPGLAPANRTAGALHMMRRREFITLLGGAVTAPGCLWPLAARAQQPDRMRRIGVLMPFSANDPQSKARLSAFQQGLQKLGWADGRNLRIDARW